MRQRHAGRDGAGGAGWGGDGVTGGGVDDDLMGDDAARRTVKVLPLGRTHIPLK
jgi:hypothetical protein